MANPIPSIYFPGISLNGNSELVMTTGNLSPPGTFPEMSNAEADPTTGDIRDMAYSILLQISRRHDIAAPEPVQSVASDSVGSSAFPNYTRIVSLRFVLSPSGTEELLDEP